MKPTILFAHDQQECPEARQRGLEQAGFAVHLIKSHAELMSALTGEAPALVLIDSLLEGKTGFESAREVRARDAGRTFPIVLCTHVYRLEAFRKEALRCGAQELLLLPLPTEEFVRRIQLMLAGFAQATAGGSAAA
ncbi:MAG: response regulator [Planctomycetes bacterium]|nr:response regulator [Planctomycetota bacterium]